MTVVRRTPMPAGLAALVLVVAGCSSGAGHEAAAGRTTGPAPVTTPILPSATARPAPSAAITPPSSSACPATGSARIPDGAWAGPLTVRVRGTAPGTGTRGKGSGELQVIVEKGRVTGGTWALTWTSAGASTANDSRAILRLRGGAAGTVAGTAVRPVLRGRWVVTGTAAVTSPVTATAAIEARGRDRTPLAPKVTACRSVGGSFTSSFATGNAWSASTAAGRWTAHPTE